jgi:hypothetical protein
LTSGANVESSFRPDVTHDGGIGYGLWGHNGDRLAAMRQFAGVGPNDDVPWEKQALFALQELRNRPEGQLVNKATTPQALTDLQMQYEVPNTKINDGAYDQRLAATREYMQKPPGIQVAQADTGTVTDALPTPGGYAPMPFGPTDPRSAPAPTSAPVPGTGMATGGAANIPRGLLAGPSLPSPAVPQDITGQVTPAAPAAAPQGGLLGPQAGAPQTASGTPTPPQGAGAATATPAGIRRRDRF